MGKLDNTIWCKGLLVVFEANENSENHDRQKICHLGYVKNVPCHSSLKGYYDYYVRIVVFINCPKCDWINVLNVMAVAT